MLLEVRRFRQRVSADVDGLVRDLRKHTGRGGHEEAQAWRNSLPKLAQALDAAALDRFHVQFGEGAGVDLEYQMPAAAAWCDAVLLGRDQQGPSAVLFELKHWATSSDRPGPRASLIRHFDRLVLHPSAQVEGYTEYCRRFHSAVLTESASVAGCVLFTADSDAWAYRDAPHGALVAEYPVFTMSQATPGGALADFLRLRLTRPDLEFARRFANGVYQQDRNFVAQVARTIQDQSPEFVLLDAQRLGFEMCLQRIDEALAAGTSGPKAVVIIEGPPGSGKSVVAAHLWAALALREDIEGPCVLVSTSGAQASNWERLFDRAAGRKAGAGLVIRANRLSPGLTPRYVKEARARGEECEFETWEQNLESFLARGHEPRIGDDHLGVAIVDEAHALIDPTVKGARGVPPSGWAMHAGPQAWHVLRTSRVSVFLTDPRQSYRDNELTTPDRIEALARQQGIETVERISLGDAQFRCGGSAEYVQWVEDLLAGRAVPSDEARGWRAHEGRPGRFVFELTETPQALEEALRREMDYGRRVRLVASYARKWVSQKDPRPHDRLPQDMDFHIPFTHEGQTRHWSRIWNYAPGQDYTFWVQAPEGAPMARDPLCEVGCPYVVRGFDYDCIGLLWLEDLVWRKDRWEIQLEHVHESAWRKSLAAAKKGKPGAAAQVLQRLQRGYRILLSRAVRGLYVWCADAETRDHLAAYMQPAVAAADSGT